jgi:uncharacterized protein (TIGR03435 family)
LTQGHVVSGRAGQDRDFEAASIKPAEAAERHQPKSGGPGTRDPGRVRFVKATLAELLQTAYSLQSDQLSGPDWIANPMSQDRYDLVATLPAGMSDEEFHSALRKLLVDRFDLAFRHETRQSPGYDLVVAKTGSKLTEASPSTNAESSESARAPSRGKDGWPVLPSTVHMGRFMSGGTEKFLCQEISMAEFARNLGSMVANSINLDRIAALPRVSDRTGLPGKYSFRLEYACARCGVRQGDVDGSLPAPRAEEPALVPDIFGALEKQLGLHLQKAKDVPVDVLVVERASRIPKPN